MLTPWSRGAKKLKTTPHHTQFTLSLSLSLSLAHTHTHTLIADGCWKGRCCSLSRTLERKKKKKKKKHATPVAAPS